MYFFQLMESEAQKLLRGLPYQSVLNINSVHDGYPFSFPQFYEDFHLSKENYYQIPIFIILLLVFMAKVLFGKFVQDKYFLGLIKNDDFNEQVLVNIKMQASLLNINHIELIFKTVEFRFGKWVFYLKLFLPFLGEIFSYFLLIFPLNYNLQKANKPYLNHDSQHRMLKQSVFQKYFYFYFYQILLKAKRFELSLILILNFLT